MAARIAALGWACTSALALAADGSLLPPLETREAPSLYRFTTEAELPQRPAWTDIEAATLEHATLTRGAFVGAAGAKIHYRLYAHREESRGGVVISSGRTEGLALYQETILDLVRNGYSVYIHDHRGQGFSQRLLTHDTSIGYVDEFSHYVADLASFIDGPVAAARQGATKPLFILAHSMGGTVAALYLEAERRPRIAAAALVTPMMEPWVASGASPGLAARLFDAYCDTHAEIRRGPVGRFLAERYADGAPFDQQYAALRAVPPGTPNDLTHSATRFARHWQTRAEATCAGSDCGSAHAKVGGVSYRWLNQACIASEQARSPAAARIAQPVLLLQGERDTVVKPDAQREFCDHLNAGPGPGYCVGRKVPNALHAILIEDDRYRLPALHRILSFFDCTSSGQARCD